MRRRGKMTKDAVLWGGAQSKASCSTLPIASQEPSAPSGGFGELHRLDPY